MAATIQTDHKWKNFLYGYELPKKQRKEFDWMSDDEFADASFIRYRRKHYVCYFALNEFMHISSYGPVEFKGWDGYTNDTYFSGYLIKVSEDCEQYQIASFCS